MLVFEPFFLYVHNMTLPNKKFVNIRNNVWKGIKQYLNISSVQSLSRVQLFATPCIESPGLPIHHQLLEFTQTHIPQVGDAIQPSHPLSSPSPAGSQIVKDEPRVGPNTVGNFVPDPGSSKYLVIIQL